ncbi:hypothetical protein AAC387_Pa04g0484 [Persea americana]
MEDMEEEEMEVFEACASGDKLALQRIFEKNTSLFARRIGRSGDTSLHLVCRLKQKELASVVLGLQPDLAKVTNNKEETPLHEASRVGELEIVKELLKACPSAAYMINRDKESALFIACSCGHLEVAWELCSWIDFLAWDEIGASCLRIAASKGYTEIVRTIIGENPSLAMRKDEKGFSALHLASSKGNLGVMNEFLEKDPNLTDNNGDTILHLAARINCLEVIELLMSNPGMKVNTANNEGNTTVDILEQIRLHYNDANVAVDVLKQKQIPASDGANDSYHRRRAIIKQLKARESASPVSLTGMQLKLIAVAGLIVTVSFQTVLSPPGGLWQDLGRGNHTNHIPGKAIQSETNPGLFTFLMASDALGFLVSLALIPIIMILRKEMLFYVNSLVVLALISIEVVFILSLIMISNRKPFFRVEVFLLVLATLAGIAWMQWKRKPQLKCR